jgi:uncharacterized protein YdeI (YjbR/CyaY-like superfamily)
VGKRDQRVDVYIAKSAAFAKPILKYLRDAVHAGAPDVEETLKWSMPFFDYKGPLCNMAAFKEHCAFGFWKSSLLGENRMARITSVDDLPPKKELVDLVKKAAKLNAEGVKVARSTKAKPELKTPSALTSALAKNKKAKVAFGAFAPSHRREYIAWITEAKTDATRERRLQQAVEWIAEGKSRNWKYEK